MFVKNWYETCGECDRAQLDAFTNGLILKFVSSWVCIFLHELHCWRCRCFCMNFRLERDENCNLSGREKLLFTGIIWISRCIDFGCRWKFANEKGKLNETWSAEWNEKRKNKWNASSLSVCIPNLDESWPVKVLCLSHFIANPCLALTAIAFEYKVNWES